MKRNLSMLTDFYEFTMVNGLLEEGKEDIIATFDLYFRTVPDQGGFAIAAGLEQVVEYIENLHFDKSDIEYFRSLNIFDEKFISFLEDFEFTGDVWAIPEGSVVFPNEPLITVKAPSIQCFILETMMLLTVNHQTLIATKANRIVRAAKGRKIIDFGARRAHNADAANFGARASFIGGVVGTSNTLAAKEFNIPALGTMAHSWIMMFDSEYDAFKAYAKKYLDSTVLLVDTYNTLRQGIPNAIKVFDEVLKPMGKRPVGIRLDSGDLAFLSKEARKMLDAAGYEDVEISASSGLDEFIIRELIDQGAKIDTFGVGERLMTSKSNPVFGGVYKLVSVEIDGEEIPKMKISENVAKITTPCFKNLYRFVDRETGKAKADLITLHEETIDDSKELEIFHPTYTWKRKTLKNFKAVPMMKQIFKDGELIYDLPSLEEIIKYREEQVDEMWEEVKRFDRPHQYIVDLSHDLWSIKHELLYPNGKEE